MNDQIISIETVEAPTLQLRTPTEPPCCDVDHSAHAQFETSTGRWDKVGLFLSSLCAVHCLVLPLLVLGLPFLGDFFTSEWTHPLMALFVVPVGLYAFGNGYRHHREWKVLALGVLGISLVVAGLLIMETHPHHHHHFPHGPAAGFEFDVLTIAGSLILVVAHLLNRRACLCHKHT